MGTLDSQESTLAEAREHASGTSRMGEIFLQAGKLSERQLQEIVALQNVSHMRFGEAACHLGFLSQADIQQVLAQQFNYTTAVGHVDAQHLGQRLPIASMPYSAEAEAVRQIRSEILLHAPTADRLQFCVLSPEINEGKSYTAANLAVAFAQLGKRTLLIDANLRAPSLHEYFKVPNKWGLSTLLTGRHQDIQTVLTQPFPSLWLLPAGPLPPNPLEILQEPLFSDLVTLLSPSIDVVIVDTPPTQAYSDGKLLARQIGASLILARQHQSKLSELERLAEELRIARIPVMGLVYNQFNEASSPIAETIGQSLLHRILNRLKSMFRP